MTKSRNWMKRLTARGAAVGVAGLLAAGGMIAPSGAEAGGLMPAGGEALRGAGSAGLVHKVDWRRHGRGRYERHYRPRPYRPRHYRPRPRVRYVYRRDHGDDLGAAIAGFALGIVTYHVLDTPPAPAPVPAPATYQWTTPPTITGVAQPAVTSVGPIDTCRMTREYQTRVMIGGAEHNAYGTACLQPDGSWRLGPPKIL